MTTSDTTSNINLNGGTLVTNGVFTATNGTINLGGGPFVANEKLDMQDGNSKIVFGEGSTLTINKALVGNTEETNKWQANDFVKGAKGSNFDFTTGGTLVLNAPDINDGNDINIMGTNGDALTLGKGTIVFKDSSVLVGIEELKAEKGSGKINLNGGTLATTKVTADASHFDFSKGGTLAFGTHLVAMDSAKSGNTAQTKDTGSKITGTTTLNSNTMVGFLDGVWVYFEELKTNGADVRFANGTLNVKNLTANASDLHFTNLADDGSATALGGTIELATGGKHDISGNLTLDDKQSYKFSAAGTLNLDSLSLTKMGNITFAGKDSVLNLANGMTSDNAKEQIKIADGGTLNFNGGNSLIKGAGFTTTASKETLLNVNSGAGVSFESLDLKDKSSKLTLNGGFVNMGALTTAAADSLDLKQGTLNFVGKENDDGSKTQVESTIAALTLAENSTAVLNFNDKSSVKISDDNLDLGKTSATLNFNQGSLVTMNGTNATLTAHTLNLNGGQINLKKLVASKSERSDTLNLRFMGASASVKGDLANTNAFTLGTDDKGNHFIGKDSEEVKISANSSLALNLGTINANGKLTTEASGGKLIFGGGSLNVGAGGSLTIADMSKNLELKDGVGGLITLEGDGTKGGAMTISDGALDLSKTSLGIKIENGGKLTTTKASKISGSGNAIQLSDYTGIRVYGDITTATNGEFSYNKMGDLTLGKETTLGIYTSSNADGNLQEITAGKLTATSGANLAFGNGGVVKLTGATTDTNTMLNNAGFGSGLTFDENAVLEFASGSVNVKGVLGVETGKAATLKVSNAVANLNGGLSDIATDKGFNKIELGGGTLNIKQDLTASGLDITHIQTNAGGIGSVMNIDGTASITSSKFAILPLVETGATSYKVLSTTKGLTVSDLNTAASGTTGEFRTRNSLNGILSKYGLQVEDASKIKDGDKVITAKDSSVNVSLKNDGKNLFLERKVDVSSLSAVKQASLQADIDALGVMDKDKEIVGENSGQANTDVLKGVIDNLKARQTTAASQSNTELASELGGANSDILLSAFGKKVGAINELTRNAVALDIVKNGGQGIVADIKEGASSAANMSSSTSSVINTMNLSNDMAISGRIAQANNPYGNLAQGFAGYEYAAVSGDLPLLLRKQWLQKRLLGERYRRT